MAVSCSLLSPNSLIAAMWPMLATPEGSSTVVTLGDSNEAVVIMCSIGKCDCPDPDCQYYDFELASNQRAFTADVRALEAVIGPQTAKRILLFDEIQNLPRCGSVLKVLHDHFEHTQVVATGSAAFLMLKNIGDSLIGRKFNLTMHPLTPREMLQDNLEATPDIGEYPNPLRKAELRGLLDTMMVYGALPEVHLGKDAAFKQQLLRDYVSDLLLKDLLQLNDIRNPAALKALLSMLALQLGSEVNPNELAAALGIGRPTVMEYIALLEHFQIIYRLRAFSTNQRTEIHKKFKVYFTDLGLRNAVIENFTPAGSRSDHGGLFENLVLNILRQNISYYQWPYKLHFWRTTSGSEVDVVTSTTSDALIPIEIKYRKPTKPSRAFLNKYQPRITQSFSITRDNLGDFL